MDAFSLAVVLCLGLIFGSFLNALSFRFNTGRVSSLFYPTASGRSACMRCGHVLHPKDLIPLLSWLFLRGRCRYCGSKISWQYPLVEAAAALLAVAVFAAHQEPALFTYWLAVWLVLLFVVVYDARHKIIPWSASVTLLALAVLGNVLGFAGTESLWPAWWGAMLGVPLLLISLISRGRAMGWGDGILELSLGLFLGLTAGLTALLAAFWSGALVGVALLLLNKNGYTMKSELPFAPFLILGAALAYFLHADLFPSLPLLF